MSGSLDVMRNPDVVRLNAVIGRKILSPLEKSINDRVDECVLLGEASIPFQTLLRQVRRGGLKIISRDGWNIELQEAQSDYDNGILVYRGHWSQGEGEGTWDFAVICVNPTQPVREQYGFHSNDIFSILDMQFRDQNGWSAGWMGRLFAGALNAELEERVGYSFPRPIDGCWVWKNNLLEMRTDRWPYGI